MMGRVLEQVGHVTLLSLMSRRVGRHQCWSAVVSSTLCSMEGLSDRQPGVPRMPKILSGRVRVCRASRVKVKVVHVRSFAATMHLVMSCLGTLQ